MVAVRCEMNGLARRLNVDASRIGMKDDLCGLNW